MRYLEYIKQKVRTLFEILFFLKRKDNEDYYVSEISPNSPWVYICYISNVFYHKHDEDYLSKHQNKREALAQVEILNEMGYNVYVQDYRSKNDIPTKDFKIIFGHEPNFVRAAERNSNALKILYVPGAYIEHRNGQIIKMTDYVNKQYNSHIPYRRLLQYDNPKLSASCAYNVADEILLIGSKYTVETFPQYLHHKITKIHQSTQYINTCDSIELASSREFFFMASGGNLLKGFSLLVEYFSAHPEYIIHIVGPVEPDVKCALDNIITDNIKLYGFIDIKSEEMQVIMHRCNFIIYPSGSEGMPGAVLNSMKNGLIPIVTKWSSFDEIEDYGYVLEEWTTDSIDKGIEWAMSLSDDRIIALKTKCCDYVCKTYNIDRYKLEFKTYIESILQKYSERNYV